MLNIVKFELSYHALSFADMSIGSVGVFRLMTSVLPSFLCHFDELRACPVLAQSKVT
jgi:hypothetical protein